MRAYLSSKLDGMAYFFAQILQESPRRNERPFRHWLGHHLTYTKGIVQNTSAPHRVNM
jgi:hypothetical protein